MTDKSMISFMTAVVVRDDQPWSQEKDLTAIYNDAPNEWPQALHFMSSIARENGCRFVIPPRVK